MARYEVTAPDGGRFEITAPDDATEAQVMSYAQQQFKSQEKPEEGWRGSVSRAARPLLEGGGAAIGAILGAGAGVPTGPGAALTGVAGGGLGYAIGKGGADLLDEQLGLRQPKDFAGEISETASDIATGAALEMGGQIIAPAFMAVKSGGKWLFQNVKEPLAKAFTEKGVQKAAGDVLRANTSAGEIYAKNAAEAAELEKLIPGLKFTYGQRTNDPAAIKLERTQIRGTGSGAQRSTEQVASNNEALRAYYERNFGGKEGVDDLLSSLRGTRERLQGATEQATAAAQTQAARLPVSEPPQTGQRIVNTLKEGKETARKHSGQLYDAVPNIKVSVDDMLNEFVKISKPMSKFEDPSNVPDLLAIVRRSFKPKAPEGGLVDEFGRALEGVSVPKEMDLNDLAGLRSAFLDEAAKVKGSQVPNMRLAARLENAARAVESAIGSAEGTEATGALRTANKFFRESYAGVFRQGTVGQILRPGARREETKTPLAKIPSLVWNTKNLSAADDFIKASPKASDIMRDHAAYDLLQSATDAEGKLVSSQLNAWMARNRPLLKKFGIAEDFAGVTNAQRAADAAQKASVEFEKSVAARVLNADPERVVAAAFSGRNAGGEAAKLVKMVEKDRAAKKGLQRAFADHLMGEVGVVAKEMAGDPTVSAFKFKQLMAKYAPVTRALYKDEPEKIKALNTMRRAYEVATRNTRSPIGGGSDTAENILTELGKINVLSRTATIIRGIYNVAARHGKDRANALVTRALFDPDYAKVLIDATRGGVPEKQIQMAIDGKIVQLDAYRKARMSQAAAGAGGAIAGVNGDAD